MPWNTKITLLPNFFTNSSTCRFLSKRMYGFNLVPSLFTLCSTVRRFLVSPVEQTDTSLQPFSCTVDFEIASYHDGSFITCYNHVVFQFKVFTSLSKEAKKINQLRHVSIWIKHGKLPRTNQATSIELYLATRKNAFNKAEVLKTFKIQQYNGFFVIVGLLELFTAYVRPANIRPAMRDY